MKFSLGILFGFILGSVVAVTYVASAQLAPFDAPLGEQLRGQHAEQYLRLERELERREHHNASPRNPCPY